MRAEQATFFIADWQGSEVLEYSFSATSSRRVDAMAPVVLRQGLIQGGLSCLPYTDQDRAVPVRHQQGRSDQVQPDAQSPLRFKADSQAWELILEAPVNESHYDRLVFEFKLWASEADRSSGQPPLIRDRLAAES